MSGAMTVNRSTSVGQISDQSQELNGYPWMRSSAGPGALDPEEDVEAQVVEVLTGGLPAFQFGVHGPKLSVAC